MQIVRTGQCPLRRIIRIQQIPIDIVLHHEPTRIKPVVKDLTPHDVPPHTPAVLITLVSQPVVAQHLRIVVVRLEAAVMHMWRAIALEKEETVVINLLGSLV